MGTIKKIYKSLGCIKESMQYAGVIIMSFLSALWLIFRGKRVK